MNNSNNSYNKMKQQRTSKSSYELEEESLNEEEMKAEKLKALLHKKIDACFTKYGTYGLGVIDEAISDGLSSMINGTTATMVQETRKVAKPQQRMQPRKPIMNTMNAKRTQRMNDVDESLADVASILEGLPDEDDTRIMITDKGIVDLNKHPEADPINANNADYVSENDTGVFDINSLPDCDVEAEQSFGLDPTTEALLNGQSNG